MAKFMLFCFILIFGVLGVKSSSLSCGGVLETSRGTLEYSVLEEETPPELCVWIIKLPVSSSSIRFQLHQIPESSHLSLYPQGGQAAGQITVLPISLTSQNLSSTVESNSPNMIVVWSLPSTSNSTEIQLNFNWSSIKGQDQNGSRNESDFIGGVNYVEASRGKFTWEYAGLEQQTLLWVLNSNSDTSLQLQTETKLERCDLIDPCLCSYFGVYEVHDNFLRIVTTECSRTSTTVLRDVRPILVALAFVNPLYRNEGNYVSLSWRKETEENLNSTTTTTSTTTTEAPPTTCSPGRPRSCSEIQRESNLSGFQLCAIYPLDSNSNSSSSSVQVMCDFETDGGGWTIIQKREKGPKEEFYRNWTDYAQVFYGNQSEGASGNYWIGLEIIHALTNQSSNQSLRIDLEDWYNTTRFAQYSSFSIGNSSTNYTLNVGGYSRNSSAEDRLAYHNGMPFSTRDRDNDASGGSSWNCAELNRGGWWYNYCYESNLNGFYLDPFLDDSENPDSGIRWKTTGTSSKSSLQKRVSMKIRDANFIDSLR